MGKKRKKGRPVSGWLVLDKPYDFGSTEAVSKVKWLFQAQKAGHAGTLDPLATGVLPIALGEATKTTPYIFDSDKCYRFKAKWGIATKTDDAEGDAIARSDHRPSHAEIDAILPRFTGEIDQVPPQFSAVKVNGERAYDVARDGEVAQLESRKIVIHDLRLIEVPSDDEAVFEAVTGKGAYVRSLVRDIAEALGTCGHVSELRRVRVGAFDAENAISLADLEAIETPEARDEALTSIADALIGVSQATIDGPQAARLRQGQACILSPPAAKGIRGGNAGIVTPILATLFSDPVAICELDGLKLSPIRVFNL